LSSDSSASRFIQSLNQPRRLLSKTILATMLDARRNLGVSNYKAYDFPIIEVRDVAIDIATEIFTRI
jgi:hypothetical protein